MFMGNVQKESTNWVTLQILGIFFMNNGRKFASVIKDHVQVFATLECSQSLLNTPIEFLRSFAFPGKDTDASSSDAEFNALFNGSQGWG